VIIRPFKAEDYNQVIELLKLCNVEPPVEQSDLKGICYVAEIEYKIVGCLWAVNGLSTCAYLDFFAIHPDYQNTKLGWNLLKVMDKTLRLNNIHRYYFYIEPDNTYFIDLVDKYRKAYRVRKLRDLQFYRREIGE